MKKKIVFASMLAVGALNTVDVNAATTTVCNGTAGSGTAPSSGTAGSTFIMNPFSPKCSNNVYLQGEDINNGGGYAVGAVSAKGKTLFGGSTNGGAVGPLGSCSKPGGCTTAEAGTALSSAVSAAGSS